MIGKLDDYLRFNEAALSLRSKRQELLASNIANADTPNYKARDVDFASALKGALGATASGAAATGVNASAAGGATSGAAARMAIPASASAQTPAPALALSTSSTVHLTSNASAAGALADGTPLLYRTPAQGAVDGNTVDMDVERNQFADNGLRYETSVTLVNAQIKGMLAAIQAAP
jgi:flagellar basal-body rod protein FlgB